MSQFTHFYKTKQNGLSDLHAAGKVTRHIEETQFITPVPVSIDDDPFGPEITMGVLFVTINLYSLEVELGGYPYDPETGKYDTKNYTSVITGANRFRLLEEGGAQ